MFMTRIWPGQVSSKFFYLRGIDLATAAVWSCYIAKFKVKDQLKISEEKYLSVHSVVNALKKDMVMFLMLTLSSFSGTCEATARAGASPWNSGATPGVGNCLGTGINQRQNL